MASGRPVIAYQHGGVTETVTEGLSGIFFKDQTVASLVQACRNFEKKTFSSSQIVKSVQKFNSQRFMIEIKAIVEKMS